VLRSLSSTEDSSCYGGQVVLRIVHVREVK
jgi:hypothetical protein